MKRQLHIIEIVLLALICQFTHAQNIGVQVNMNLTPPYTLSLHDYTQPGSNKMMVTILLKDLNYPAYRARLRFTIEGSGFTLTTKASYMPMPINLQGGVPSILGATDLEEYFLPENMDFNGLSKSDYLRTKKLPEGFYRFYVEVLDYNRGSVVSNKGMTMAYIVLNDPPVINLPLNNSKTTAFDPQNILFNWAPRHLGSPNSAFTTEYEFRLYEIQPKGRSAYEVVHSTRPIYEAVPALSTTSLLYGMAMPQLIPGNEYAFTVRAVDREGRDLFKNDGYSDVFMFTYGDECKPPLGITGDPVTGGGIELKWKTMPQQTEFNIHYRTKGSTSWLSENALVDNASIYDLPASTDIQLQVQSVCGGYESDFSDLITVKTKAEDVKKFVCGAGSAEPAITNTTPKSALTVGSHFTAGGYTAIVTKVTGSAGTFSGECNVVIPFFNRAKVPHTFNNIKINELNQMYEGKLVSVYNPDSKFVVRIPAGDKGAMASDSSQNVPLHIALIDSVYKNSNNDIIIINGNGEITTIHRNDDGSGVMISAKGDSTAIPAGKSVVVADNAGHTATIDSQGNITRENTQNPDAVSKNPVLVRFYPVPDQKYGFDALKYDALKSALYYNSEPINGTVEYMPWKSASKQPDNVYVRITPSNRKVKFVDENNTEITAQASGVDSLKMLIVPASLNDGVHAIRATYTDSDTSKKVYTAGVLNIIGFDNGTTSHQIVIVPVNTNKLTSSSETSVQTALNEIYKQACETFAVSAGPTLKYTFDTFDANPLDAVSYTDDMSSLIQDLKDTLGATYDPEKFYLFLLNKPSDNKSAIMPFNQNFGFIFTDKQSGTDLERSIAHELGHGAFGLMHTFETHGNYAQLNENSTDNLMDYAGGRHLFKFQWSQVNVPVLYKETDTGIGTNGDEAALPGESDRVSLIKRIFELRDSYQKKKLIKISNVNKSMFSKTVCLDEDEKKTYDFIQIFSKDIEKNLFIINNIQKFSDADGLSSGISINSDKIKIWCPKNEIDLLFNFLTKSQENNIEIDNPKRKVFFVHGTTSSSDRWTDNPLTIPILLKLTDCKSYDANFNWNAPINNNKDTRALAANELAAYINSKSEGYDEIVIIGHSHGGNVAIQTADKLFFKKVYIITISTPAYNDKYFTDISGIKYNNPENPMNCLNIKKHIALWNEIDGVSGGFAGDDFFTNNFTNVVKIAVDKHYKCFQILDAHTFDVYYPQSIKNAILNKSIPKL